MALAFTEAVVLWISGFVLIGLGILVRNGHPELIAGYDPENVADPEKLVAFVSRWTVVLGVFLVASGFVPEHYRGERFGIAFVVLLLLFSGGMVLGANRYS
jgi:hypothetical protein